MKKDQVVRVFWPIDVLQLERRNDYQPSLVVGWKNAGNDLVVVTTLSIIDIKEAETLLRQDALLAGTKDPAHIYQLCGQRRMSVLGTLNVDDLPHSTTLAIDATLDDSLKFPNHHGDATFQVIAYELPQPYNMQFFSVDPISLELSESASTVISEEYETQLVRRKNENAKLVEKIKLHSLHSIISLNDTKYVLNNCVAQINCSHELGALMRKNASVIFPKLKARRRRRMSMGETVIESAISVNNRMWVAFDTLWHFLIPLFNALLFAGVIVGRILAELVLRVLELRVKPSWYALKDISATAQQIDLRLQQFCFWPVQYLTIRKRSQDWSSNNNFNVEYIRFYNSIWLVINDIILGAALGGLILENADLIVDAMSYVVDQVLTAAFKNNMLWLMDWPGGLKLNSELAAFFGELFLWVIQFWNGSLNLFRPYFRLAICLVGYAGFAGATYAISLVCDIISLLTLHVYSFYVASARLYHWQLVVLQSLFHLFRGKKHNVLRKRIDRCNYDLDQLLMGTIFFTVLIFLLPTVLMFYLTFASARLGIVLISAVLETCLTFLNHFPLFAILLRLKDSKRLPGGIRLDYEPTNKRNPSFFALSSPRPDPHIADQSFVVLKPLPLSFSKMFHQYRILTERLQMHYLSMEVIKRLLTGQFVPMQRSKLYGLLYSMLPEERIKIQLLYKQLREVSSISSSSG